MAAQFTATKGPFDRGERSCRVRATSSLPVPLSPLISTGAVVGAATSMRRYTACMPALVPTRRPIPQTWLSLRRSSATSRSASPRSAALGMSSRRRATSTGLVR